MKITVLVVCAILSIESVNSGAIKAPLSIITLDDLSEHDRRQLEYLDQHFARPKRSQSDLISLLKTTIGQGIKSKIGLLAKGSGYLSSGSSGSGHSYHHAPESHSHKTYDIWSLKKSIFNTLLQAVKAIKGGVIAIKGQLIKGGGYLVSAKGKLISAKGEAITNLGKHIISSAQLVPYHGSSSGSHQHIVEHEDYGASDHYHYHHHHSGGSTAEYTAPSAPDPEYQVPIHYQSSAHGGDKPEAGILIIKKIPKEEHLSSDHDDKPPLDDDHDDKVPDFKPIEPSQPGFSTIVGKFLSASSSLNPDEPKPFGYTSPGHDDVATHESYASLHNPNDYHSGDQPPSGPPPEDYSSVFEKAPSYLNEDESKDVAVKQPSHPTNQPAVQHYDEIRPLHLAINGGGGGATSTLLENNPISSQISDYFSTDLNPIPNQSKYPNYPPLESHDNNGNFHFGGFQANIDDNIKYLSPPNLDQDITSPPGLSSYRTHYATSASQYVPQKTVPYRRKRPVKTRNNHPHHYHNNNSNNKRRPSFNVVKSIGYELRPDGPKRL